MPCPTSFETRIRGPRASRIGLNQPLGLGLRIAIGENDVGEPERQAIDQHGFARSGQVAKGVAKLQRCIDRPP